MPICCVLLLHKVRIQKNVSTPAVLLINTFILVIAQVSSAENRGLEARHRPELDGSIITAHQARYNAVVIPSVHLSVCQTHVAPSGTFYRII